MCKHVSAVLYGVGARLDEKPDLFFTLRGVDMQELLTAASDHATAPMAGEPAADRGLEVAALSEIFGVEIEAGSTPVPRVSPGKPVRVARPVRRAKPAVKAGAKKRKVR